MPDFLPFAEAVNRRLKELTESPGPSRLLRVDAPNLFDTYLAAFPEGTNPIFRERTHHDCNCCKQFIRNLGSVVVIRDHRIHTIWESLGELPEPYGEVARLMDIAVRWSPILGAYYSKEASFGKRSTIEVPQDATRPTITWKHFWGDVPATSVCGNPGEKIGRAADAFQVLRRGLQQIKLEHLDLVLDLIDSNNLYRGQEHRQAVQGFRDLLQAWVALGGAYEVDLFAWEHVFSPHACFRNTVIGTLLVDLAEGLEEEVAVRRYESKVAPTTYKRTSAVITQSMVQRAVQQIELLGLRDAINRRFARPADVSVNDALFVDRSIAGAFKDGITSLLQEEVKPPKLGQPEDVTIDDFLAKNPKRVEVVLERPQLGNFVSLTAPVDPGSGVLFQWDNGFAWSYDGDVADSIKERVAKAGGNVVDAKLRVSLAWNNFDDLDIHCFDPQGRHIYYGGKFGVLDVDMNAGGGTTREPVENLSWREPEDGVYKIVVNQFRKRENVDFGFRLQVESGGVVHEFAYPLAVVGEVPCLLLTVSGGLVTDLQVLTPAIAGGVLHGEKWGVRTRLPVRVNMITRSPNHWDGAGGKGNLHWFFFLDGCRNPEPTRGIYNEFLRTDLLPHRKVFEVLGAKTKCEPTEEQLSGVGFSSARGDTVVAVADRRPYRILF